MLCILCLARCTCTSSCCCSTSGRRSSCHRSSKACRASQVQCLGWVLVNEPRFLLGFGSFSWKFNSFTRNEAQDQHNPLDTIFYYIVYFGPPGKKNIYNKSFIYGTQFKYSRKSTPISQHPGLGNGLLLMESGS